MQFSLETKTVSLSVGEFAAFSLGPREGGSGSGGLWRAQLGQHWHNELRKRAEAESLAGSQLAADLAFEIPVVGRFRHRGWTFALNGRIDQLAGGTVREIKSVTDAIPADESRLRADYPDYFLQAATYLLLLKSGSPAAVTPAPAANDQEPITSAPRATRAELIFVEASSGLSQTIPLTPFDEALVHHQLDAFVAFLDERVRASIRRRSLVFHSPFSALRPGQENVQSDLRSALDRSRVLLFEAPTGYGKTGCLLEFALGQLKSGRFGRLIWLTGKATGQLQVVTTLQAMTSSRDSRLIDDRAPTLQAMTADASAGEGAVTAGTPLAVWQVRPKTEHCVNHTYHCLREACGYLEGGAERWPQSGLARFYLDDRQPRDLATLRQAGQSVRICPYEITRTALAFQDVWIGDYNYVFAPANRGIFRDQPGFDAADTLLVIDEAHNLPARVADSYSHAVRVDDVRLAYDAIHRQRGFAHLALVWEKWTKFISRLKPSEQLDPLDEADLRDLLADLAPLVLNSALDHAELGPQVSATLWQVPLLAEWLEDKALTRLLWSPRAGELNLTCLDAAPAIGATLRSYGAAVLMSATLSPSAEIAAGCGLDIASAPGVEKAELPENDKFGDLNKRTTRKLFRQLTSGAELLRAEEAADTDRPVFLRAPAPWREGAYDVAIDLRVSTTLRDRERSFGTTAETVAALHQAAGGAVAVFFPSYDYADAVMRALDNLPRPLRVALQPRQLDLAAQHAWMEENLALADALFLVLGGSFAEGIDLLGGRVTHAMVVGPALPEVNAVQRARLSAFERGGLSRDGAFRRVYQAPGLQKVNQALGRLVRAPGHRAKVLLHCRRFAEPSYAALLAPEYQFGREIVSKTELLEWLGPAAEAAER